MLLIRRVEGLSMLPRYQPGSIVVGLQWLRPRVGSVIVVRWQGREIMKRVNMIDHRGLFLLGDNLTHSSDSRQYGWFAPTTIVGVIIGKIR